MPPAIPALLTQPHVCSPLNLSLGLGTFFDLLPLRLGKNAPPLCSSRAGTKFHPNTDPGTLLLCWPTSSMTAVPNLFGTRDPFHGRQFFHWPRRTGRGWGWRGMAQAVMSVMGGWLRRQCERRGAAGDASAHLSTAHLPLGSRAPNRLWTGTRVGDPCSTRPLTYGQVLCLIYSCILGT